MQLGAGRHVAAYCIDFYLRGLLWQAAYSENITRLLAREANTAVKAATVGISISRFGRTCRPGAAVSRQPTTYVIMMEHVCKLPKNRMICEVHAFVLWEETVRFCTGTYPR